MPKSANPLARKQGPSAETVRRLLDENLCTIPEARNLWPAKDSAGKRMRPDQASFLRWIKKGVGRPPVKLEGVRLGNQWFTSREAMQRFIEKRSRVEEIARSK